MPKTIIQSALYIINIHAFASCSSCSSTELYSIAKYPFQLYLCVPEQVKLWKLHMMFGLHCMVETSTMDVEGVGSISDTKC